MISLEVKTFFHAEIKFFSVKEFYFVHESKSETRKPSKGAAVIAASMHGFANYRKFKSPVTSTLSLDRVKGHKVTSAYTVRLGLPAYPTM